MLRVLLPMHTEVGCVLLGSSSEFGSLSTWEYRQLVAHLPFTIKLRELTMPRVSHLAQAFIRPGRGHYAWIESRLHFMHERDAVEALSASAYWGLLARLLCPAHGRSSGDDSA